MSILNKSNRKKMICILLAIILVAGSAVCLVIVTLRHAIPADKAVSIAIFINSTSLLLLPLSKLLFPESKRYLLPVVFYTGFSVIWCLIMGFVVIKPTLLSFIQLIFLPVATIVITLLTEYRQHHLDKDKKENEPIEPEPNEPAYDKVEEQSSTTSNTAAEISRWCLIILYVVEIGLTCWVAFKSF